MRPLPPPLSGRRLSARARIAAVTAAAVAVGLAASATTPAAAAARPGGHSPAARSSYVNPVATSPWGVYTGGSDGLYPAYESASGARRSTLAQMALRPHVRWYTNFISAHDITGKIRDDIRQERSGHPHALVWMAIFRLWPYHESAKMRPLSSGDVARYKHWIDRAAQGIHDARVAMVLEPDLPVSTSGWRPSVRLGLARYAAKRFSSLPNTTVYLDAGSADWLKVPKAIRMLKAAGIRYVHGFALGSTHHTAVVPEIRYGRSLVRALTRNGIRHKHFIVDTSDNGHGYTWASFWAAHPNGDFNDPPACATSTEHNCVSLGIPPTTDVTNPSWGLPRSLDTTLRRNCDAFMWIARPWLADNGRYFNLQKSLAIVRSSPFFS